MLLLGVVLIYSVALIFIYFKLDAMIDRSGNHLIQLKQRNLVRKNKLYSMFKHNEWQNLNNNVVLFYQVRG